MKKILFLLFVSLSFFACEEPCDCKHTGTQWQGDELDSKVLLGENKMRELDSLYCTLSGESGESSFKSYGPTIDIIPDSSDMWGGIDWQISRIIQIDEMMITVSSYDYSPDTAMLNLSNFMKENHDFFYREK